MNERSQIRIYFCRNAVNGSLPNALLELQMREDVLVEAVPCGGKIDPRYLLKTFESGARAACVLTCPIGHCRTMQGNLRAERRVEAVRELLEEAGADAGAVRMFAPESREPADVEAEVRNMAKFVDGAREPARKVAVA
jgi:coenzyme F420-reducing hydrogenase delta subunit